MFRELMERALKERIIGAVVLVIIAVLVVPVFLNGPSKDAGTITEPVTLPGQNGQPQKRQTIVLERDRDRPLPASAGQSAAGPAADASAAVDRKPMDLKPDKLVLPSSSDTPSAAAPDSQATAASGTEPPPAAATASPPPQKESPPPAAAPKAASDEPSATGMWAVQVGSFSSKTNAEALAADLRKGGYAAFLSEVKTASGAMHRVRIGPQKDKESAQAVAAKLKAGGHDGQAVPYP